MFYKKIIIIIVFFNVHLLLAQYTATDMRHYIKVEGGSLRYYTTTLSDKSQDFSMQQNAWQINAVWGWDFDEKRYLGMGAGFLNFKDLKGVSAFGEINFFVSNSYINPYIGARLGYSMVKPDQMDMQGNILAEFLTGLQIRFGMYSYYAIYLQTGLSYQQKSLFVPVSIGLKF